MDTSVKIFPVPIEVATRARINKQMYADMYRASLDDPTTFWTHEARRVIDWIRPFSVVKNTSFTGDVSIKWFEDGCLNACYNCVDRHLADKADKVALIWESDEPDHGGSVTFRDLHRQVCRMANVLTRHGVKKGDVVTLYMPMILEAVYAMLACARIGAIHAVVFGGFSADALAGRMKDCGARFVITADEGLRGGKKIPLKASVDQAVATLGHTVEKVFVVSRTGADIGWDEARDVWLLNEMDTADDYAGYATMNAEDPLFILYTSGSTGAAKGMLHTTGGYMVWAAFTHETVFDIHDNDVYWCTADVGWITGHSYLVYGPLANGCTSVVFEGVPTYPDAGRFWDVVDKHQVTKFYTAPTAIRSLMAHGDGLVKRARRRSLKILGSVGEPINPEAWMWYYTVVGEDRCRIVDTWWQTETGGHMITALPGVTDLKPGAAQMPFFGVRPVLVNAAGAVIEGAGEGLLCIADSWPGQARTIWNNHKRFVDTYFAPFKGLYFSSDDARRDADGDYWITGRDDDVMKVSGHRLGSAEIESALVAHASVAEAAVVGYPHPIKGQGIYAYVILRDGHTDSDALRAALIQWVRTQIGPVATPDFVHVVRALPKTRSGKIMRRILRKIVAGETKDLGDTSTLADPEVVHDLIAHRMNA